MVKPLLRRWHDAATVVLAVAWVLGCVVVAGARESILLTRVEEAAAQTGRATADTAAQYISRRFAAHRSVVRAMAFDREIRALLQGLETGAVDPTAPDWHAQWLRSSSTLAEIADAIDITALFLVDMQGMVRAASDRLSEQDIIRIDVSQRPYFVAASHGRFGEQFAMNLVDGTPGYFFSAPVRNAGAVVGVLVARSDLRTLEWVLRLPSGSSILVDHNGVAVLTPDEAIRTPCVLADARPLLTVEEIRSRYGTGELPVCAGKDGDLLVGVDTGLVNRSREIEGTGLQVLHASKPDNYDAILFEHRVLWIGLALVGAVAIVLASRALRYFRDLKKRAVLDALTGLFNRGQTANMATVLLDSDDRDPHRRIAALLLDIDRFKAVNDTFGHTAGDIVLKRIAAILLAAKRKSDILGRWGGEEFAVFGHVESEVDALAFGERIRLAVAACRFAEPIATPGSVTVSVGVAIRNPGETLDSLVSRADGALYAAKAAGRDCVLLGAEAQGPDAAPPSAEKRRMVPQPQG